MMLFRQLAVLAIFSTGLNADRQSGQIEQTMAELAAQSKLALTSNSNNWTIYALAGKSYTLHCRINFDDGYNLSWRKGPVGKEIEVTYDDRVRLDTGDEKTLKLLIDPVAAADHGRYTCGKEEFLLQVYEYLDAPTIKGFAPNSTIKVKLNDTVPLVCQWNSTRLGQLEPSINWWYEGSSIFDLLHSDIEREIGNDGLVHLWAALSVTVNAENNDAQFQCTLTYEFDNPFGNNYELVTNITTIRLEPLRAEEESLHPQVHIEPAVHKVVGFATAGRPYKMQCKGSSVDKKEDLSWKKGVSGKEKKVVIDGVRIKKESNDDTTLKLRIDPVTAADRGRYTCGSEVLLLQVYEYLDAPTIKGFAPNSTIKVKLNDTVPLVCLWNSTRLGQTEPFMHWWHKGSSVVNLVHSKIERKIGDDGLIHLSAALNVTVTTKNNGTEYLCSLTYRVKNQFDSNNILGTNVTVVRLEAVHGSSLSIRLKSKIVEGITVGVICLILIIVVLYCFYQGKEKENTRVSAGVSSRIAMDEKHTVSEKDRFLIV